MTNKTGIFSRSKGNGKTTTCAYLAAALSTMHRKVVCVDLNGDLERYFQSENTAMTGLFVNCRTWEGPEDELADDADYILVDIPANPTPEQEAVFHRLDSVLIPVAAEYYGPDELNKTLMKVSEFESLLIRGFVLTQADPNSSAPSKIRAELEDYFSSFVFNSSISRNYYLSVPGFIPTDLNRKGWHSGFIDYLKLANELLEHEY